MLLLQLLELLLLLLLLMHEGKGYITGGSCSLQGGMNQRGPDDRAWPRGHRATSSHDAASSCSGSSRDGILHGRHAVVLDDLLHQHAITRTQTARCKAGPAPWAASTTAAATTHAAPQRTTLG